MWQKTVGTSKARRDLQARRLMYGMTRKYLSKLTGVSASEISAIEHGVCMPRFGTMKRIAHELHFKWEDFYKAEGVPIP